MAQDLLSQVIEFIVNLIDGGSSQTKAPAPPQSAPIEVINANQGPIWTDPKSMVTEHFSVSDALLLHQWGRLATQQDGANFASLLVLCQKMEQVRDILGCSMNVHCMYRSPDYNKIIGAPPLDAHSKSLAIDFDGGKTLSCDQIKEILLPKLESLGLRMEDNGAGASWVHLDMCPVIHNRFFKP